ncbi:MAG: SulP family inorganic anion transporter [Saprospiraceae bacterium]
MLGTNITSKYFKTDFSAGLVVFLVALPLCLGIALASGAPLFSGIISGIIGGIIVGVLSHSNVSVSGPAAGLTAIVLAAITTLGSFEVFLMAVVLAGLMQLLLGLMKAGSISNYFPNNVIEGMLVGIGIIIFLKQIPHALGYDKEAEGSLSFEDESTHSNTIETLLSSLDYIQWGAVIITLISLAILLVWERVPALKKLKLLPGALVAVVFSIILNELFIFSGSPLAIDKTHLVSLPVLNSFSDLSSLITLPDFASVSSSAVWIVAITITAVASIETLLCIEASDRLDKFKRYTSTNTELIAQGVGNTISGLIGGLPMTSVVIRTTANINSGARTKMSAIIHGVLLLICALSIPWILNKIPLATLAAILLLIGYKLASPKHFKHHFNRGLYQFLPFIVTVVAVVGIDLLKGVAIGMVISLFFILKGNLKRAYYLRKESYESGDVIHFDLAQEVSFLNKAAIKLTLGHLPNDSTVIINAANSEYIAHDVLDIVREFQEFGAAEKGIKVELVGFKDKYNIPNTMEDFKGIWVEKLIKAKDQTMHKSES